MLPRRSRKAWVVPFVAVLAMGAIRPSAYAQDRPKLVWAADTEGGEPYIFRDPDQPERLIGFEKEIADALAKEMGRPIEFKQYDFKNLTLGLKNGDFDFAMNGLELTEDRRTDPDLRHSKPYYAFKLQLVFNAKDEHKLNTLEDCRTTPGVIIGTLENTAAARLLQAMGLIKGKQYEEYDSVVTAYLKLKQKDIHAVLMDLPIARYYADPAEHPEFRWAEKPLGGRGYYVLFFRAKAPDAETTIAEVNAAFDRLWQDGTMRRIYEKWGLWNDNQEEFLPDGVFGDFSLEVDTRQKKDWHFRSYFPLLLAGAWETIKITVLSFLLAIAVGMPVALARLYAPAPIRWLAAGYVEFFRGIPVLLLLYFLYFGLPAMVDSWGGSLRLNAELVAILGLGLTYAAYEAEIYRAGINAIPAGQWEAAASLGMSPALTFRRVVLPQALRTILPPSTSDLVALFKDTSVVSVITLVELSKQYQILATAGADYLTIGEIGLVTAALYLVMSVPLGLLSRRLEQRWGQA